MAHRRQQPLKSCHKLALLVSMNKEDTALLKGAQTHVNTDEDDGCYVPTQAEQNSIMRAVRFRILPLLFLVALFCYFDRANLSFAALQMNHELNFTSEIYGTGAGIFFAGYAGMGLPCSIALKRFGHVRGMGLILLSWGTISGAQSLINGPSTMYALRFFLGVSESAFFPLFKSYCATWFAQHEIGFAYALVDVATAVSGLLGGPLAGGLINWMNGVAGLSGWRWLFIIEAIPSVALGAIVWIVLPANPEMATFLGDKQRNWLCARQVAEHEKRVAHSGRTSILSAICNFPILLLAIMWLLWATGYYGIIFWIPLIVQGSYKDASEFVIGLLTSIPFALAGFTMLLVAWNSDRTGERRVHLILSAVCGGMGLIVLGTVQMTIESAHLALLLLCLSVAAIGIWCVFGPFWAIPASFLSGDAAAAGLSTIICIGNVGGFIGPYILGVIKELTGGFGVAMIVLGGALMLCAMLSLLIPLPNTVCGPLPCKHSFFGTPQVEKAYDDLKSDTQDETGEP